MQAPKISIITPSYNQGHFLEQTICSVLDQKYPNLEYFVIDGGSTDNSVEIIRKYEKYITYWTSEKDRGQSEAINKGFARATGDVVNWLNSDDYYEHDVLRKVGEAFSDPATMVLGGRSRVFGGGSSYLTNGTDIYPDNVYKTIGFARIDQPETFFRHTPLQSVGYVNESLHFIMDKEMWIRFLLKFGLEGVRKSRDVFVNYRLHETSKTVSLKERFAEETCNLYYTYAVTYNLPTFRSAFERIFNVKELSLPCYDGLMDQGKAYKVVNYYLLEQALIAYASNNFHLAKTVMQVIDKTALHYEDQKALRTIGLRMRLPVGLKQIFNQLRK